ncbi:MAG: tRNA pseudouridine(38-40) synthase TruA [Bacillota bacterium]|nr:tRNA pseudouridine(38-40) synthase TruA [Bacillota bacterium]
MKNGKRNDGMRGKHAEEKCDTRAADHLSNYLLTVAYDGSGFCGWQSQQNGGRTVQDELTRIAKAVFKQDVKMEASGRTDAGVHATGQAVSFLIHAKIRPDKVKRVLNHSLPGDIRIVSARQVPMDFHARYNSVGKTYVFKIIQSPDVDVFRSRYYHYVSKPIELEKMRKAAAYFIGTHDFVNFSASNHGKKSTIRTIHTLEISEYVLPAREQLCDAAEGFGGDVQDDARESRVIEIRVSGNGFLWKMVRMIAQTLIDVGTGSIEASAVKGMFKMKNRRKEAAPACGLYLEEVGYELL